MRKMSEVLCNIKLRIWQNNLGSFIPDEEESTCDGNMISINKCYKC